MTAMVKVLHPSTLAASTASFSRAPFSAQSLLSRLAIDGDQAMMMTDELGIVRFTNAAFTELLGYDEKDLLGKIPGKVLQGTNTDRRTVAYLREQTCEGKACNVRILNYTKSGRPLYVNLDIHPVYEQEQLLGFVAYIKESPASAMTDNAVQDLARLDSWSSDRRTPKQLYSGRFLLLFGRQSLSYLPAHEQIEQFVVGEDKPRVLRWLANWESGAQAVSAAEPSTIEYRVLHLNGEVFWLVSTIAGAFDSVLKRERVIGTHQDVTYRVRSTEAMKLLALVDVVTGLPNRLAARVQLQQLRSTKRGSIESGRQFAVALLDLDGFKQINDTHSHECGDAVLRSLGSRLSELLDEHEFAARLGGDEFCLIAHAGDRGMNALLDRLEEIRLALAAPISWEDQTIPFGVSVGVYLLQHRAETPEALLHYADLALYEAKRAGKNCLRVYHKGMQGMDTRQSVIERRLSQLQLSPIHVSAEKAEPQPSPLNLEFQPIVSAHDGSLVAAEALLRWNDESLGSVAPAEFVPIAERSGDIKEIGLSVMLQAFKTTHDWAMTSAAPLRMGVNVSAAQLTDDTLHDCIARLLSVYGMKGAQLELEITETYAAGDLHQLAEVLKRIKSLGVSIAIDDFGSGHCALSYLQILPIDRVKIDRKFVSEGVYDKNSKAILLGVRQMTQAMGIQLAASGVETAAQAAYLREIGCDELQGFWVGHPLGSQQFVQRWLAH